MIDDSLYNQYHDIVFNRDNPINKALVALAARINPAAKRICGWWDYILTMDSFDKRCLICEKELMDTSTFSHVEEAGYHGMQHLKEYNLLPFV